MRLQLGHMVSIVREGSHLWGSSCISGGSGCVQDELLELVSASPSEVTGGDIMYMR